eukprot:tig00021035_g17256.t1
MSLLTPRPTAAGGSSSWSPASASAAASERHQHSPTRKYSAYALSNIGTSTKPRVPSKLDGRAAADADSPNTQTRVVHFDRILNEIGSIKAQLHTLEPAASLSARSDATSWGSTVAPAPRSPPTTEVKRGAAMSLEEVVLQLQRQVAALEGRARLDESLVALAQEIARSSAQDSATMERFAATKEAVSASAAAIGATLGGSRGASLASPEERLRAVEERVAQLDAPGRRGGLSGDDAAALQRQVAALEARLASAEADAVRAPSGPRSPPRLTPAQASARTTAQAMQAAAERAAAAAEALEGRLRALEAGREEDEKAAGGHPFRRAQAAIEQAQEAGAAEFMAGLARFEEDAAGRVKAAGEQQARRLGALADRVDEVLLSHKAAVEAQLASLRTAAARDLELVTGVMNNVREEQRALLERLRGSSEEEARRGRARTDALRSDFAALAARLASVEGWCYGGRARSNTTHAILARPLPTPPTPAHTPAIALTHPTAPPSPALPAPPPPPPASMDLSERDASADAAIAAAQAVEVVDSVQERLSRLEGFERESSAGLVSQARRTSRVIPRVPAAKARRRQVARVEEAVGEFRREQAEAAASALHKATRAEAHAGAALERAGAAEGAAAAACATAGAAESRASEALDRASTAESRAEAALAAAARARPCPLRPRGFEAAERSLQAMEAAARAEGACEGLRATSAADRAAYRAELDAGIVRLRAEAREATEEAAERVRERSAAEAREAAKSAAAAAAGEALDVVRAEAASRAAAIEARLSADIDAIRRDASAAVARAAALEESVAAERAERAEAGEALSERVAGALGEHAAAVSSLERHVSAVEEQVAALAREAQARGAAVERAEREVAALRAACLEKVDALRAVVESGQLKKESILHDRLDEIERIVTDVAARSRTHDAFMRELKSAEVARETKLEALEEEARHSKRTLTEALKVMNHALEDAETAACEMAAATPSPKPCPAKGFETLRKSRETLR